MGPYPAAHGGRTVVKSRLAIEAEILGLVVQWKDEA